MSLDLDAVRQRHLNPKRTVMRTYYEGHIEVDLAACVAEIENLRAEVAFLRSPILPDEVCVACGHKKFYHFDYRRGSDSLDVTKCFGRGLDCDDCPSRCERFVRSTHPKETP